MKGRCMRSGWEGWSGIEGSVKGMHVNYVRAGMGVWESCCAVCESKGNVCWRDCVNFYVLWVVLCVSVWM